MTTESITTIARAIDLESLHEILKGQHVRKVDAVVPASKIRVRDDGVLVLADTGVAEITEDGVTPADGLYRPTEVFDDGASQKLNIPRAYLRRMREDRPDHYARCINVGIEQALAADPDKTFLVRAFRGEGDQPGMARAFLSDRFALELDHLDALVAVLHGVKLASVDDSGQSTGLKIDVPAGGADLSERGMRLRITAPGIKAYAPGLLAHYRSPFTDGHIHRINNGGWTPQAALRAAQAEGRAYNPGSEPVAFAGFQLDNSETGNGKWRLTPVVVFQVCSNGLHMTSHAVTAQHLGGKLDAGVRWGQDTQRVNAEGITLRTRDAVRQFLDPAFIAARVAELEKMAGKPVEDAAKAVELVSTKLTFTEVETATVLDHFIRGGQLTAGGVMNAVSSAAQTIEDPDRAQYVEVRAVQAMELAYAIR
jgi:hypothetical protein